MQMPGGTPRLLVSLVSVRYVSRNTEFKDWPKTIKSIVNVALNTRIRTVDSLRLNDKFI